jgi:hypothetical protein
MKLLSLQTVKSTGFFQSAYWKVQLYLPSSLRPSFDNLALNTEIEGGQIEQLEMLGEEIGLNRKEVYAAYTPPLNVEHWRSRMTPFTACVMILIILIVSLLIASVPSPYYPPSTYPTGARYGSIKPLDFTKTYHLRRRRHV